MVSNLSNYMCFSNTITKIRYFNRFYYHAQVHTFISHLMALINYSAVPASFCINLHKMLWGLYVTDAYDSQMLGNIIHDISNMTTSKWNKIFCTSYYSNCFNPKSQKLTCLEPSGL